MRLQDKVILITGSCTGIGKAMARRCAEEGACIVVHGLERELGEEVVAEIGEDRAALHIQDLTEEDCPKNLLERALNRFGKLDGLVNNAAVVHTGTLQDTPPEAFRQVLEVNLMAPYRLIQAALPELEKQGGSVLNIGSVNAWSGEPNLLPYSISKGGLMTLTRNLGDTLMRENGVRVNQINPGWVLTENEAQRKREHGLKEDWYRDLPKAFAPSGRILWPKEIAAAAVYWLADECGPVSGQTVDLEQHPFLGRNPPKDSNTIPG